MSKKAKLTKKKTKGARRLTIRLTSGSTKTLCRLVRVNRSNDSEVVRQLIDQAGAQLDEMEAQYARQLAQEVG